MERNIEESLPPSVKRSATALFTSRISLRAVGLRTLRTLRDTQDTQRHVP